MVRTGCSWRQLPAEFPPWQTVYWYFTRWEDDDQLTERMLETLREQLRVQQGRNAQPTAGIIDSRSVKGADTVGRDSRGYHAAKRINGRKPKSALPARSGVCRCMNRRSRPTRASILGPYPTAATVRRRSCRSLTPSSAATAATRARGRARRSAAAWTRGSGVAPREDTALSR